MSEEDPVKWPGKAYDAEGADLGVPLQRLLVDLHVLEKDGEEASWQGTPASVQVITAGTTALGKAWPSLIALFGGGSAILTGLRAWGVGTDVEVPDLQRTVLTASASVLASAVALAIAVIVKADVSSRATASAAQYQARASIASSLLESAHYNIPIPPDPPKPPAPVSNYLVQVGGNWYPVKEFKQTNRGVVAELIGRDDDVAMSQVQGISTSSVWDNG